MERKSEIFRAHSQFPKTVVVKCELAEYVFVMKIILLHIGITARIEKKLLQGTECVKSLVTRFAREYLSIFHCHQAIDAICI